LLPKYVSACQAAGQVTPFAGLVCGDPFAAQLATTGATRDGCKCNKVFLIFNPEKINVCKRLDIKQALTIFANMIPIKPKTTRIIMTDSAYCRLYSRGTSPNDDPDWAYVGLEVTVVGKSRNFPILFARPANMPNINPQPFWHEQLDSF